MIKRVGTDFDKEVRYKLYRTVKDLITPSISKVNISNYRIVFDDTLLPVRVFYPKRVSDINKVIIYVPGDGTITNCFSKYSDICSNLALELDKMIIAIDYTNIMNTYPSSLDKIEEIIKYLYKELINSGITNENITLMGDSTGGNYISSITFRFIKENLDYINKEILLYPLLSGDYSNKSKYQSILNSTNKSFIDNVRKYMKKYATIKENLKLEDVCPILNSDYNKYPKTLIVTGELDPLKDEAEEFYKHLNNDSKYLNITLASHGFINSNDFDIKKELLNGIKEFI